MANPFETDFDKPELDSLSSLAQHLVYRFPYGDDDTLRLALREVYRDFCRRSCCLRVRRRFPANPDGRYAVPSVFGELYRITEVSSDGRLLREGREYSIHGNLVQTSRCDGCVTIAWIEMPSLSSESAPRCIIERHGDAICSGVLARLYAQANRPWSDPQTAAMEAARYENFINEECQSLYSGASAGSGSQGSLFDASDMI